jgi:hypothetical protein
MHVKHMGILVIIERMAIEGGLRQGFQGSDRGGSVIEDPDANIRKSQKHARLDHEGCPAWSIICIAIRP